MQWRENKVGKEIRNPREDVILNEMAKESLFEKQTQRPEVGEEEVIQISALRILQAEEKSRQKGLSWEYA